VAFHLRAFSVSELRSLTGATRTEAEAFVRDLEGLGHVEPASLGQYSLSHLGEETLVRECLAAARTARRQSSIPGGAITNKFRLALLAARRMEELLRGARPRLHHLAKPLRLALAEVEAGLVQWNDPPAEIPDLTPWLTETEDIASEVEEIRRLDEVQHPAIEQRAEA
jgi:DNA-directed RNA polymerase subunit K/omega